jgi:hypothetical protein
MMQAIMLSNNFRTVDVRSLLICSAGLSLPAKVRCTDRLGKIPSSCGRKRFVDAFLTGLPQLYNQPTSLHRILGTGCFILLGQLPIGTFHAEYPAMNENLAADYAKLVKEYCELADRVRMIRRAVEKAFHAGVLSSIEPIRITPLQECEAIARAIYRAAVNRKCHVRARNVAGLCPDNLSVRRTK